MKHCAGSCGKEYPATVEFWHRNKSRKDGLCERCKVCRKVAPKDPPAAKTTKVCTGPCGKEYPATVEFFHKSGGKMQARCKECVNTIARVKYNTPDGIAHERMRKKDYLSRPETRARRRTYDKEYNRRPERKAHRREYLRTYYSQPEIKEQREAYLKEYNARPEIKEHAKEYRLKYKERPGFRKHRQNIAKAYKGNEGVLEQYRVYARNRHARKRAVNGVHTPEQIQDQLKRQKYRCYYAACGHAKFKKVKGKYSYHIEHTYPLSRVAGSDIPANSIDYLVLACPSCNTSKKDKFPWEWPEGGRLL